MINDKTLYDGLSREHRKILDRLGQRIQADPEIREKACEWIHKRMGSELADHFDELSDEGKIQACIEHTAIGMVSGDISIGEVKRLIGE